MKVLFIQLPQVDNDVRSAHENVHLAAACLSHSVEKSGFIRDYDPACLRQERGSVDDYHLLADIAAVKPDVIAATLYLWNVERTLRILGSCREMMPKAGIVVGGPETDRTHPFLFKSRIPDVAVEGEGESVFPEILRALRTGCRPKLTAVGWKTSTGYCWGASAACARHGNLVELLPPPRHRMNTPDANGMAYLESGRGCPLNCSFCCYGRLRRTTAFLTASDVAERVRVLRSRGAREIRFVDPTFNANPSFDEILVRLARLNADRKLSFFAEVRADTITGRQAELLAAANFTDVEVGVQCRSQTVLRATGRPSDMGRIDRGIEFMTRFGIRLTVDLMCGLPRQTLRDVKKSLLWASCLKHAQVQFMHTLLLPGTRLRRSSRKLGMKAQSHPPYRVLATPDMTPADMAAAEQAAAGMTGYTVDVPTRRFVGVRLPDLFAERIRIENCELPGSARIPGRTLRRALILAGRDIYGRRDAVVALIKKAVRSEPHVLWQFVLAPVYEEPLDLLEIMAGTIDRMPSHFLDNQLVAAGTANRHAARRAMILLRPGLKFERSWISEAEYFLAGRFH